MPQRMTYVSALRTVCALSLSCLIWISIGALGLAQTANADPAKPKQDDRKGVSDVSSPAPPEKGITDEKATVSQLDVATQEMRNYLKKMRVLAVNYHMQDDPSQIKSLGAEWRSMLAGGHRIHDGMIQAAMADFRAQPDLQSQAGVFLSHLSGRNADADRYDNMMEVVQLLKDHGSNDKSFDLCYALTAVAHNQYAAARPHLEVAAKNLEEAAQELAKTQKVSEEERKMVAQKLIQTYEMVRDYMQTEAYEAFWQEELKAREADSAGEPLPRVLLETTKGEIVVELFENNAPNTVANFIELCEKGTYNGLPFHRVLTHFMAQGGDPARDGTGGPGYSIPTELNGQTDRKFFRGTLGMAMSSLPNSGGSQFYICYLPRGNLNGKYVAFGRVVEGMNIVSDFAHIDPEAKEEEKQRLTQTWPDEIISTKVLRKRAHEYKVIKLPEPKPPAAQPQEHDHAH